MIEELDRFLDAVDGFRTVVHDPNWPYFVGALRFLIRTFVNSLPTNRGCNGLSSIKPFPERRSFMSETPLTCMFAPQPFPVLRACQRIVNVA